MAHHAVSTTPLELPAGCGCCGGANCACLFDAGDNLNLTLSGFVDDDCGLGSTPNSCLNGTHPVTRSGSSYVQTSTTCSGAFTKSITIGCTGTNLSVLLTISSGVGTHSQFSAVVDLSADPDNTCDPLHLEITGWTQVLRCQAVVSNPLPGVSGVLTL